MFRSFKLTARRHCLVFLLHQAYGLALGLTGCNLAVMTQAVQAY